MANYFPKLSKGSVITFLRKDTEERVEGAFYELKPYGVVKLKNVSLWTKDNKCELNPETIINFPLRRIVELEVIRRVTNQVKDEDGKNNDDGSSSKSMEPPSE